MRKHIKVINVEENTYTLHPDSQAQTIKMMRVKPIKAANEKYGYSKNTLMITAALAYYRMNQKEVEDMISADQFDKGLLGFLDTHEVVLTELYDADGNVLSGDEEKAKKVELDPLL